jgi:uncharacterized membrane protein
MSQSPQTPGPTSGGLEPNIAGLLAYLFIPAILWLLMEPYNKDRFIRFHSFQGLALGVVWIVISVVLGVIPILGWILAPVVWLALVAVAIFCAYKAYLNEKFKLPVLGEFAEKQAG